MHRFLVPTTVIFGLIAYAAPATAGQHCVVCQSPAATYLCEAQNGPGILAANGGQLACITELAKRGGHDSCSVMRQAGTQCDGLAPTVLYPGASDAEFEAAIQPPTPTRPVDPAPPPHIDQNRTVSEPATAASDQFTADDGDPGLGPDENHNAEAKPKDKPPKTVAEMADQAYESSKKGLGKAGKTVGDSAKAAGKAVTNTAKKTGEQIGKAGKAVGSAAKKTWDCVTSLFSDC